VTAKAQRPIDRVEIKAFWIERAADPLEHSVVLFVLRIFDSYGSVRDHRASPAHEALSRIIGI
jgi:hypothetical protein